jgi:membrane protein implicated in regulation of membrane protease activity
MPARLLALVPAALLLLLAPAASAQDGGNPADTGFPVALLVLAVVAVVFALVWRAVSKKRQDSDR